MDAKRPSLSLDVEAAAPQRRAALKAALEKRDLRPVDAARIAKLKSANSIYNFLAGRSNGLSATIYAKLAESLPDCSFDELMGSSQITPTQTHDRRKNVQHAAHVQQRLREHTSAAIAQLRNGIQELHRATQACELQLARLEARLELSR